MDWTFYFAQGLGVLATVCLVVANQFRNMRYILLFQMLANLLTALSSFLLGGLSGAWICAVAAIQTSVLYILDKKSAPEKVKTYLLWLFAVMYIGGTVAVYSSWRDLISCGGAMLFLVAVMQERSSRYRGYICVNASLWLVYNLSILAFGNMLTNAVELGSAVVGILRLDRKRPVSAAENT